MDIDGAYTRSQMVRQRTLQQRSSSVGALRPAGLEMYVTHDNTRMGHGMVLHGDPDIGSAWQLVLHGGRHCMQTDKARTGHGCQMAR